MGWWATGHDDDIMGDDVADTLVGGFRHLEEIIGRKPTFQELLDTTSHVLRNGGETLLSNANSVGEYRIKAVFEEPDAVLVSRPDPPPQKEFSDHLADLFAEVGNLYLETGYHRKPRLTELLHGLAFILRVEPERFLQGAEGLSLVDLRVKNGEPDVQRSGT